MISNVNPKQQSVLQNEEPKKGDLSGCELSLTSSNKHSSFSIKKGELNKIFQSDIQQIDSERVKLIEQDIDKIIKRNFSDISIGSSYEDSIDSEEEKDHPEILKLMHQLTYEEKKIKLLDEVMSRELGKDWESKLIDRHVVSEDEDELVQPKIVELHVYEDSEPSDNDEWGLENVKSCSVPSKMLGK